MASTGVTGLDSNAIYYEVSPTIICTMRLYNLVGLINVLVALTICIVKGHGNEALYLLACNLVLSGLVCIVVNWWYRRKELYKFPTSGHYRFYTSFISRCPQNQAADKYWFVFLLTTVILFQAIIADVYAFQGKPAPTPTPAPPRTISTMPYTGTTVTWVTINMSSSTPFPYLDIPPLQNPVQ